MADDKKHVYDESKIETLSSLEHIRLRTACRTWIQTAFAKSDVIE